MKKLLLLAFALLYSFSANAAEEPKLKVVASFSIIADMAQNIGGDKVEVYTIAPAGTELHSYEPNPQALKKISEADIVLVNGLGADAFMQRIAKAAGKVKAITEVSSGVTLIYKGKHADPHAWQSLRNAVYYIRNIERALCAADAANSSYYAKNSEEYISKTNALDENIIAQMKAIPANQRKALVPHDSFAYFTRDYGVEFLPISGLAPEEAVTAKTIAGIITTSKKQNIKAIFADNDSDDRLTRQIASEAKLQLGGKLYSDSLSVNNGAKTYLDMFKYNSITITKALN